jgi:cellobiose phosphorylase
MPAAWICAPFPPVSVAAVRSLPVAKGRPAAKPGSINFETESAFAATRLGSASGLEARITRSGALFSLRHGPTLINQVLPGPAEDGLSRVLLRWREGRTLCWAPLTGSGIAHSRLGPHAMEWTLSPKKGWLCHTTLALHPKIAAWAWQISLCNTTRAHASFDVSLAQDLGLGNPSAVRNSEAFSSQYIDLLPVRDPELGWTILARQNLPMEGGLHPWLAMGCASGADAFCTDGSQFFGADYRLARVPEAARAPQLCSRRLQYECALCGLQSRGVTVGAGGTVRITFIARFLADHPEASQPEDLARLRGVLPANWIPSRSDRKATLTRASKTKPCPRSLFVSAPWLHGQRPAESDWTAWFPGERRHEERGIDGRMLSFFSGTGTHVVSQEKEAVVARPHGHILRSGAWRWIDPGQFGTTCYAAGIFSAQAYLGNPSFARLLPVVRDSIGAGRASGQRVFVRRSGAWHQLGVPSAFSMTTGDARWIYKVGAEVIEARVWASVENPAIFLELRVGPKGHAAEFLVTHTLALDANEFESPGKARIHKAEGWASCKPGPASVVGARQRGCCFAIAAADREQGTQVDGDGPLYDDGLARSEPCITLRSLRVGRLGVILCGTLGGLGALPAQVEAARAEWTRSANPAVPLPAPVRLALARQARGSGKASASVARVDEILPWFAHNAAIHFSAPHGLEQHGGAAWGVRDVCQGSVEWLLASREWGLVRRALETVFSQQYAHDGSWPQWFMHPPYQSIQQVESHVDVSFWPVKALCDYAEASNDLGFFQWETGYTDPKDFTRRGPDESLLRHCDRVIDLCERQFLPGTALVHYGEGDWDDTLQPADPEMRPRMVSSWTVGLAFHTFRQLAAVYRRLGEEARRGRVEDLLSRMRRDFADRLMPGGVVAGFLVTEPGGGSSALLHPSDTATGIRYRLLPMTRAVLAELFTQEEAARHMAIVQKELLYPDGVRLMSEPGAYHGGCENLFKRADTAANVGREIGLQYVHAHLRYAEALAKVGDAERLWTALQVVNPVALNEVVGHAMARQSNVYFSSSDANFNDRYEAQRRWPDLRTGKVGVRGGWRLYSSGPGLYLHKVRACLLGLRESFGKVVFDPVLPKGLGGLVAKATLAGRPIEVRYSVRTGSFAPRSVSINGTKLPETEREPNPYRAGGLSFDEGAIKALLNAEGNIVRVEL